MSAEFKVLREALAWYRYVLRTRDSLSSVEKRLFDAVHEMNNQDYKATTTIPKKPLSSLPKPNKPELEEYEEWIDEKPTTPVPSEIQLELIEKSKDEN